MNNIPIESESLLMRFSIFAEFFVSLFYFVYCDSKYSQPGFNPTIETDSIFDILNGIYSVFHNLTGLKFMTELTFTKKHFFAHSKSQRLLFLCIVF